MLLLSLLLLSLISKWFIEEYIYLFLGVQTFTKVGFMYFEHFMYFQTLFAEWEDIPGLRSANLV